jgi:hypothetical protein
LKYGLEVDEVSPAPWTAVRSVLGFLDGGVRVAAGQLVVVFVRPGGAPSLGVARVGVHGTVGQRGGVGVVRVGGVQLGVVVAAVDGGDLVGFVAGRGDSGPKLF